jgi:hypothetical protein
MLIFDAEGLGCERFRVKIRTIHVVSENASIGITNNISVLLFI